MTLPGPLTVNTIAGAAVLFVLLTAAYAVRKARARKRLVATAQAAPTPAPTPEETFLHQLDARLDTLARRLEKSQTQTLVRIQDDIRGLQSDMDWLAGERMIEEAISMARVGQSSQEISGELGISVDQAETISRFRKH